MRIGIDFDNTIITYDDVFRATALGRGLIKEDFAGRSKQAIRDHIRLLPDGEIAWQRLQGQVRALQRRRCLRAPANFSIAAAGRGFRS